MSVKGDIETIKNKLQNSQTAAPQDLAKLCDALVKLAKKVDILETYVVDLQGRVK